MNLPEKVQIVEVGPRDGFQNIKTFIETKHKLEIIDSLEEAGCNKSYFICKSKMDSPNDRFKRNM